MRESDLFVNYALYGTGGSFQQQGPHKNPLFRPAGFGYTKRWFQNLPPCAAGHFAQRGHARF